MELNRFFNFRFLQGVIDVLISEKSRVNSRCFYSIFSKILPKFLWILLKFVKIFKNSVVDFIFQDKQALLIILIYIFWSKTLDKYFKIQPSKTTRNKLL